MVLVNENVKNVNLQADRSFLRDATENDIMLSNKGKEPGCQQR